MNFHEQRAIKRYGAMYLKNALSSRTLILSVLKSDQNYWTYRLDTIKNGDLVINVTKFHEDLDENY